MTKRKAMTKGTFVEYKTIAKSEMPQQWGV